MTDDIGTDIAVRTSATDVNAAIEGLNSGAAFFSTVTGDDFATRLSVMEALVDSQPVDENLGKLINLTNIIVQPVEIADDKTGEVNTAPRVILLDADGTAYHGTSVGLLSSVRIILASVGNPSTWEGPLQIMVVKQKAKGAGHYFTVKPFKPVTK